MADFALLGEGLALDLANTLVREHGAAVDLLARRGAAAAWCAAHADALPGGRVPAAGLAALRDAVHETLDAAARRRRPDAAALALVDASAAAVRPKLRATPHGPVVAWTGPRAGGARALGAIARDAQAVLADPHAEVRACANPDSLPPLCDNPPMLSLATARALRQAGL